VAFLEQERLNLFSVECYLRSALALLTPRTPDRLFLLDTAEFTLGNIPALPPDGAQDATFGDALTKTLEQLFLRFTRLQIYMSHACSPPSWVWFDHHLLEK
jgi:hypothetical protein